MYESLAITGVVPVDLEAVTIAGSSLRRGAS